MDITRAGTARRAASMNNAPPQQRANLLNTNRATTTPPQQKDDEEERGIFDWEQQPGDEPGTLADVMDGTAQQDPEQEENQKFL